MGDFMQIKLINDEGFIETIEVDEIIDTESGSKIASKGNLNYYSPDGRMYFRVLEE